MGPLFLVNNGVGVKRLGAQWRTRSTKIKIIQKSALNKPFSPLSSNKNKKGHLCLEETSLSFLYLLAQTPVFEKQEANKRFHRLNTFCHRYYRISNCCLLQLLLLLGVVIILLDMRRIFVFCFCLFCWTLLQLSILGRESRKRRNDGRRVKDGLTLIIGMKLGKNNFSRCILNLSVPTLFSSR